MPFTAGQKLTAAALNAATQKSAGLGRRITTSPLSASTADVAVLRCDDYPLLAGHRYRIFSSPLALDSSAANDEIQARIRYTTDGSTPTTASPILPGSSVALRQVDPSVPEHRTIVTTYAPAADELISMLLCVRRIAGAGNASIFADGTDIIEISVDHIGEDPGDTGTDL